MWDTPYNQTSDVTTRLYITQDEAWHKNTKDSKIIVVSTFLNPVGSSGSAVKLSSGQPQPVLRYIQLRSSILYCIKSRYFVLGVEVCLQIIFYSLVDTFLNR